MYEQAQKEMSALHALGFSDLNARTGARAHTHTKKEREVMFV